MDELTRRLFYETGWSDEKIARDYKEFSENDASMKNDYYKFISIIGNGKEVIERKEFDDPENAWSEIIRLAQIELKGKTVLDLGSGPGSALEKEILPAVEKFIALDKSLPMLNEFRSDKDLAPFMEKVLTVNGDFRAIPLADESVDVIIAHHIIQNIRDENGEKDFLEEAIRTLRPGGYLLVSGVYNSLLKKNSQNFDICRKEELAAAKRHTELKEVSRNFVFLDSRLADQIAALGFDCEVESFYNDPNEEFCSVKITKKSKK